MLCHDGLWFSLKTAKKNFDVLAKKCRKKKTIWEGRKIHIYKIQSDVVLKLNWLLGWM